MTTTMVIAPGAHLEIRDAVWRVVRVEQTSSGKSAWNVVGVSEIVRDQEAIFLEEYEPKVAVLDPKKTTLVADASPQHRTARLYLEALLRDVPPAGPHVTVGHTAALDVLDFQLDPARLALQQLRTRILIADAVGLGKTLEAGILLSELIARGRARRVLVVTVKAMLTQFQKEFWSRFTIPLVRLDSVGLRRIRDRIPTNHNPFYHYDRVIISVDTLKQNNDLRHHLKKARWDVIVIDEAHNVAERGDASLRSKVAKLLANQSDALVMLSATPHDGKPESFASLMNMLDPTAIANPSDYTADDIRGLYVRRFKRDVMDQIRAHFPERELNVAKATASPAEEAAFEAIAELDLATDRAAPGKVLFRTMLEKSLLSSPKACSQTAKTRADNLRKRADAAAIQQDVELLEKVVQRCDEIGKPQFSRYQRLLKLIGPQGSLRWTGKKKDDRLVIFTERVETMKFLLNELQTDLGLPDGSIRVLDGSLSDVEQQELVEEFGRDRSPVRLLIATDVASEGINLHHLCHRLVHFDVPWSLMVFQQRNGRIDRYGQEKKPHLVYILLDSSVARMKGDQRILERLIEREDQAAKNIDDPRNLIGAEDVAAEETQTALAIQGGLTPAQFEQQAGLLAINPLELLLGQEAQPTLAAPAPRSPVSLFASPKSWLLSALEEMQERGEAMFRPAGEALEVEASPELRRRFARLPREIVPEDGWFSLSDNVEVIQDAIKAARSSEDAWPASQYLWPLHPIMSWAADRLRGRFGRHSAPAICLHTLGRDEAAFLVSGLVPNRQGQPVVHRWYAASFAGAKFTRLEAFDAFVERVGLRNAASANLGSPDLSRLQALVAEAVSAVDTRVRADRESEDAALKQRLEDQLKRLEVLRARQEQQLSLFFAERKSNRDLDARGRESRRIERIFADVERWSRDALTTEPQPFLQVIAAFGGAGYLAGGRRP